MRQEHEKRVLAALILANQALEIQAEALAGIEEVVPLPDWEGAEAAAAKKAQQRASMAVQSMIEALFAEAAEASLPTPPWGLVETFWKVVVRPKKYAEELRLYGFES
jgi:hypothetical protein